MSDANRFDLEQAIMVAWSTDDDVNMLFYAYGDTDLAKDRDKVANLMLGITELHNLRMEKVFDIFERMVHEGKM